jgi:hypothetical protein
MLGGCRARNHEIQKLTASVMSKILESGFESVVLAPGDTLLPKLLGGEITL